jgi:nitrogen fixation protein FixH
MTLLPKGKGWFARQTTGAQAIEIKATVPERQVDAALKRYRLTRNNDELRLIYFFDTPQLQLLEAGVIVRARRVIGDTHDSTVKARPVDPARLGAAWKRQPGFKIEVDASEKGLVKSASFSTRVQKGRIKRVVVRGKRVRSLFTTDQERFLRRIAKRRVDFEKIVPMGPLSAQRWDFEDPGCPWPITAELWQREDGQRMMELSVKAPAQQAAAVMAGFMAFLTEVGAHRNEREQAKTRWALEYYARKLASAARPPRAGRPPARRGMAARRSGRPRVRAGRGPM